jgi:hypothetical protein
VGERIRSPQLYLRPQLIPSAEFGASADTFRSAAVRSGKSHFGRNFTLDENQCRTPI